VCRSKHVEPSLNYGIINSITGCILLVFLLSHTATTITTLWYRYYDTSVPLLRHTGTAITTHRYRCYDILVPPLRQTIRSFKMAVAIHRPTWLTSQKNLTSSSFVQMRRRTHARTRVRYSNAAQVTGCYRAGTVTDRTLAGYTHLSLRLLSPQWLTQTLFYL
jgi:hypothetical protein